MNQFREYDRAVICMTKHTVTEAVNIVCMRLKVTQGKELSFEEAATFLFLPKNASKYELRRTVSSLC